MDELIDADIVSIDRSEQDVIVILGRDGTFKIDSDLPAERVVELLREIADVLTDAP
jgi:flagellar motor protein MotB